VNHDIEAYRLIWGHVLIRAIADALWPQPRGNHSGGSGRTTVLEQRRAKIWFGTNDFWIVCYLAGMNPLFIRDRVGRLINAPEAERRAFLRLLLGDVNRLKEAA
jgi:hypothetical protein